MRWIVLILLGLAPLRGTDLMGGKLTLGGEWRMRAEQADDEYVLHRIRLDIRVEPTSWSRVFIQAQDARIWGNDVVAVAPPFHNAADIRQAYAEFGKETGRLLVRAGRQEITFGENRLMGGQNWGNTSRSWDAVRATLRTRGLRVDAFGGSVVIVQRGAFDKHRDGNNLYGLYNSFDRLVPNAVLEPYLFWRVSGPINFTTTGARFVGTLPNRFDYNVEMMKQAGSVSAWAGHWLLGRRIGNARLITEYNRASPQYDVLYPTPHDRFGLADRVGWKNNNHIREGMEMNPKPGWTLIANYHTWWLVDPDVGLFNAGGNLLARAIGAPSHVGHELDFQVLWNATKSLQVLGGYGYLFPGPYLKAARPDKSFDFPFVMLTYTF